MAKEWIEIRCVRCGHRWRQELSRLDEADRVIYKGVRQPRDYRAPCPRCQTVNVVTRQGKAFRGELFDTVWVTGTLRVEPLSSDLAEAGYRLENATVAPYEEDAADSP